MKKTSFFVTALMVGSVVCVALGSAGPNLSIGPQSGSPDSSDFSFQSVATEESRSTAIRETDAVAVGEDEAFRPEINNVVWKDDAEKKKTETADITFDDIKFDMKDPKSRLFKRSMLTKRIEDLSGRKIRIRGYIRPSFKKNGLTRFVFVRDDQECCFGPGAAIYDCVLVTMASGKTADFSVRPVTVEGTFVIKELVGRDKKHLAIYRMTAEIVK